ncbi:MAG TPA: hypothetical protein EYP95_03885 [Nitrospinaceae bacterium]|jgi:hypothetical protein|nr:hypothetical protein [Nitrospinaceae bacterium]
MHRGHLLIQSKPSLRKRRSLLLFLSTAIFLQGCGVGENPVKKIQSELQNEKEYTIILHDMREEGNFVPSYYHQYRVDIGEQKSVRSFKEVDKNFYNKNGPYLGMALAGKTADGKITNTPFPNGYQYVGNSQYGQWRQNSSGGSMWEFYGKYMLMSQVMNWGGFGLSRNHYNDYSSFNRSGRPYYGPKREYGTSGTVTKKQKPDFFKRKMAKKTRSQSRFQNKVKQRMGRSKNTFRSRGFSFGK